MMFVVGRLDVDGTKLGSFVPPITESVLGLIPILVV
jgi:hypothetical protein